MESSGWENWNHIFHRKVSVLAGTSLSNSSCRPKHESDLAVSVVSFVSSSVGYMRSTAYVSFVSGIISKHFFFSLKTLCRNRTIEFISTLQQNINTNSCSRYWVYVMVETLILVNFIIKDIIFTLAKTSFILQIIRPIRGKLMICCIFTLWICLK